MTNKSDKSDGFLAHLKEGGLHKALGIPLDQKIPADRLREAMNSRDPHVRKMAQLAYNMKYKFKK